MNLQNSAGLCAPLILRNQNKTANKAFSNKSHIADQ